MLHRLFAPGVLVAAGIAAYFGGFPGEPVLMDGLRQSFGWLVDSAAHPKLFIAVSFLFLGFVIIPNAIRLFRWRGQWKNFRLSREQIYQTHKRTFHSLLNNAYGQWRRNHLSAPGVLETLTDSCIVPLPRELLSGDTKRIANELNRVNPILWEFCAALYNDIENYQSDKNIFPTFLTPEDCVMFTNARRSLTHFWDIEAEQIYTGVGILFSFIWLYKLNKHLKDRMFRQLPYLETALAQKLGHSEVGASSLFKICQKGFEIYGSR